MPAQMNRLESITARELPEQLVSTSGTLNCDQHTAKPNVFERQWLLQPDLSAQILEAEAHNIDMTTWQVDPQRNTIQALTTESPALRQQLEPRIMHLLCLLAGAGGHVVSREQLMMALWPKVIVNENSLTRAVSELRKALATSALSKSSASRCALIETVSKKGYRLNAVIQFVDIKADKPLRNRPTNAHLPSDSLWRLLPVWLGSRAPMTVTISTAVITAVLALVLSSGVLVTSDPAKFDSSMLVADSDNGSGSYVDRVVSGLPELPTGVQWLDSLHIQSASDQLHSTPRLNASTNRSANLSILSPGGDLLAFVEELSGQSTLKLRSLSNPDEVWTAFTSASPITRLQWSPLEDGILFTVVDHPQLSKATLSETQTLTPYQLARLMLLDLHSLQVRELYRRENTDTVEPASSAGSLT
jgi:DNA-binding winged helix-turn-helix (wHTH) protein